MFCIIIKCLDYSNSITTIVSMFCGMNWLLVFGSLYLILQQIHVYLLPQSVACDSSFKFSRCDQIQWERSGGSSWGLLMLQPPPTTWLNNFQHKRSLFAISGSSTPSSFGQKDRNLECNPLWKFPGSVDKLWTERDTIWE